MSSVKERLLFAKARARYRRELETAEDEEHVAGELNLVPYLDIVTNVVIFLLATTASALTLGNINVSAPRYAEPSMAAGAAPEDEDKPKLNLTVAITSSGFTVGSSNGILPKINCKTALRRGRCPAYLTSRPNKANVMTPTWVDQYHYAKLTSTLKELKKLVAIERQAILTADRWVPYQVVIRTMDAIRGLATTKCTGKDGCYFDQVVLSAGVK